MNSSRRTNPLFGDAVAFMKDVKAVFQDKREKFDEFMKLLHDFSAKRIDKRVIKEGVMELFKEHQDLISRFNIFLPQGNEISLPLNESPSVDKAVSFLTAVKVASQDKKEMYNEFLKLLKDYSAKRIDIRGVKEGAMELFKEHQELLLGLNTFFPAEHKFSLRLDGDESAFKDEQKDDEQ